MRPKEWKVAENAVLTFVLHKQRTRVGNGTMILTTEPWIKDIKR